MSTAVSLTRKQRRQLRKTSLNAVQDTKFSMERVSPLTSAQRMVFNAWESGHNVALLGTAGTGKSFVAYYLALSDVLEKQEFDRVIIVRSAVQTRDQGFMPGSLKEKEAYYEKPYADIAGALFGRSDAYSILKHKNQTEFMTSSFVRGLTFDNSIVMMEEIQNFTYHEAASVVTRLGDNSRLLVTGDTRQNDLLKSKYDTSGFAKFVSILDRMPSVVTVSFTPDDIVRGALVREFILAEEELHTEAA